MKKSKLLTLFFTLMISMVLVVGMTACGGEEESSDDSADITVAELTGDEMDALMDQVAESELELSYKDYLPDQAFANAEVFGIDREGDQGTAYVVLNTEEYVAVHGKAYSMSGGQGEAIIKFDYTEDGPALTEVVWSADGGEHDPWMEENFPEEYLEMDKKYEAHDADGNSVLGQALIEKVEEAMGATVETENLLEIDIDNGTYEIIKTIEGTDDNGEYTFDTETIEKGKLSDLNS